MLKLTIDVQVKSNRFGELARRLPNLAGQAVRLTAALIVQRAAMVAPVDTGALRNSVASVQTGPMAAAVYVGVAYAAFVEFGTRYMAAQPFFIPAIEWARPQFEAAIANALKGLV